MENKMMQFDMIDIVYCDKLYLILFVHYIWVLSYLRCYDNQVIKRGSVMFIFTSSSSLSIFVRFVGKGHRRGFFLQSVARAHMFTV